MLQLRDGKDLIFVDGSYFIFYRYYAVLNWYRLQKHTTPVEDILKDSIFVDKYYKMFEKSLLDLAKAHNVDMKNLVFFKDSPREEIWRNTLFSGYKKDREDKKDTFNRDIFKLTFNTLMPQLVAKYDIQIYGYPKLEADDLIAIVKEFVREKEADRSNIVIITNDNDYIQLYDDNTSIINLKGKELKERIPVDVKVYLKYKIISGDKSDCIPPIMAKLGPKTAEKLCQCDEHLERYFAKHPEAREQYLINSTLIDMQHIPDDLKTLVLEDVKMVPI